MPPLRKFFGPPSAGSNDAPPESRCSPPDARPHAHVWKRDIISSRKYLFTTVCCHIDKEVDRVLAPGGVAAFCVAFGMDIEMGELPEFKEILLEKVTEGKKN